MRAGDLSIPFYLEQPPTPDSSNPWDVTPGNWSTVRRVNGNVSEMTAQEKVAGGFVNTEKVLNIEVYYDPDITTDKRLRDVDGQLYNIMSITSDRNSMMLLCKESLE